MEPDQKVVDIIEERGRHRGDLVVATSDPTVRVAFSRTRALRV